MPRRLTFNEDEQLLMQSAQDFFSSNMPISHQRQLRDAGDSRGYDPALWGRMAAQMGWAGMLIAEEDGGSDFGLAGLGIVAECSGHCLSPSPLISNAVIAASVLRAAGSQGDRLAALAAGKLHCAMALEEQSWHAPERIATSATQKASGWAIHGSKTFVPDACGSEMLLVLARTETGSTGTNGLSLFAVASDAAGVQLQPIQSVDSRNFASLQLDNATGTLLGEAGAGWNLLEPALDNARIALAAEMFGIAEECFNRTLDYLRERKQFGVPIGSFQGLQHRAATMYAELEVARSAMLAGVLSEPGEGRAANASLAKGTVGEVLKLITNEAVQMHGGMGVTDELDFGLLES